MAVRRFGMTSVKVSSESDSEVEDNKQITVPPNKPISDEGITSPPADTMSSAQEYHEQEVGATEEKVSEEELLGLPYPYFYHTWPSFLFEKTENVKEVFHIDDSNVKKKDDNVYVWNNQLNNSGNENYTNFFDQHNKYGNSLQNYYTVVNQSGNLPENWTSSDRINISNITPIYLQKCENIMSTLLFMPLDQCHDFRGGRTADSTSWVTMSKKGVLKSNVKQSEIQQGIISNIYSNDFMNTLVNTSFSGMKDIVGIMVIGDDSFKLLQQSQFFVHGNINFQNIMSQLGISVTIASDIYMNCNPGGNRKEFVINGKKAYVSFLGFTSDGWDKGMHDVWSMNEKKHIFSIKIDRISKSGADVNVVYSGNKITEFENIVPCYEIIYKNMDKTGFINGYTFNGQTINSRNLNSLFEEENFNAFYENLLSELYRTKGEIHVEEPEDDKAGGFGPDDPVSSDEHTDAESQSDVATIDSNNGSSQNTDGESQSTDGESQSTDGESQSDAATIDSNKEDFLYRGAAYRFYGVRAPDSKLLSQLSPVDRSLNLSYENIFIEVLKKISKNIYPQIHSSFAYPEITDISISNETEQLNDRINEVNALFKANQSDILIKYPTSYDETKYNELEQLQDTTSNNEKFIVKQFGTVNDMNIAPTIDRVINSLNCSDNCDIINVDSQEDEEIIPNDINKLYPYRFQLVSGVLDSSLQGGENMPEYFPPEIDIFMTIFDNEGALQGIIIRMTFLETILRNSSNTKNSAKAFSHFTYIGFDEIDITSISTQLGDNWKLNPEKYPLALKQLLDYVIKNTAFVLAKSEDLVTKFDTKLIDGNYRNWYYYYSDNVGPSVSEGINNVVIRIFNGTLGVIKDDNTDVSESIVKVAQKIYAHCPFLNSIFTPSVRTLSMDRSYAFESIFLLRIKYIGDKSRCTDSLFLNRNKFAECLQITGDENAYFTALINGASTIFSPPSKFAVYFAPYFTYGDVNSEGKFLLNLPIYKETLLKGESPTGFKSISKGKSKKTDTSVVIPIVSPFIVKQGEKLWEKAKELTNFIKDFLPGAYAVCLGIAENFEVNIRQQDDDKIKTKNINEARKNISFYESFYTEMGNKYKEVLIYKDQLLGVLNSLMESLPGEGLPYVTEYYSNLINQLSNVLTDSNYTVQPVELSDHDYNYIKNYVISSLNHSIEEMNKTMEDSKNPQNVYQLLPSFIQEYTKMRNKFTVLEDPKELFGLLNELNDYYRVKILPSTIKSNISWDEYINKIYGFVSSLKDMNSFILPVADQCRKNYDDQVEKYNSLNIKSYQVELETFKKPKKTPASAPAILETVPPAAKSKKPVSAPAAISAKSEQIPAEAPVIKQARRNLVSKPNLDDSDDDMPPVAEGATSIIPQGNSLAKASKPPAKAVQPPAIPQAARKSSRESKPSSKLSLGGGSIDQESYRKNQIYILKQFSDLIKSNDTTFKDLITSDKSNIEYTNIDNIDKYCVSLLMLQNYSYFKGYQPQLESIQSILSDISVLDEEKTPLNEVIGMRNHYSPIINNYVEIEYLQMSVADYVLGMNGCELLDGEYTVYELFNGCQISYYILEFIMNSLISVNSPQNIFLNGTTSKNFGVISQLFDIIDNIDVYMMYIYYNLDKNKEQINSSTKFSSEEKSLYNEQISTVNGYEYLCLFFIKYCNGFLISLTGNRLNYSTDGLLYNYSSLLNELSSDGFNSLVDKFNGININLNQNIQDIILKLVNLSETEDLNAYIKNVIDIVTSIGNMSSPMNRDESRAILHYVNPNSLQNQSQSFVTVKSQTAGTLKNRNIKKHKNTKKNKKRNKKRTISKITNKRKQHTRKN